MVHHPLVVAILLRFDFQPHDVQRRSGVDLRVFGDVALQQEELAAQLWGNSAAPCPPAASSGTMAPLRANTGSDLRFHRDGARSLGQLRWFPDWSSCRAEDRRCACRRVRRTARPASRRPAGIRPRGTRPRGRREPARAGDARSGSLDPAARRCSCRRTCRVVCGSRSAPRFPAMTRATSEPSWRARACSSGGAVLYAARLNIGAIAADIAPCTMRSSDAFSVAQLPKRSLDTLHGSGWLPCRLCSSNISFGVGP